MADTATIEPDTHLDTVGNEGADAGEFIIQPVADQPSEPAPNKPSQARGRPRAVPLIVHGSNATGIAVGVAYAVAGVPGLAAAGLAGAAVGAAALSGRKKRAKASAGRRAAASSGAGGGQRRAGGSGLGRLRNASGGSGRSRPRRTSGAGAGGRRPRRGGHTAPGSPAGVKGGGKGPRSLKDRTAGLKGRSPGLKRGGGGASGPGTSNGGSGKGGGTKAAAGRPTRSGRAWQTIKGWAAKTRRPKSGSAAAGGGTTAAGGGATKGSSTAASASRRGRLWQRIRSGARKLRRGTPGSSPAGTAGGSKNSPALGRIYRMRRLAVRKLGHWSRMAGAGLLAGLGGLLTLPLGLLWGGVRLATGHRDPLHGFAFPVHVAGRIWRFFLRRSKAQHDKEAKADQLNLTVNDPRKDADPVSGPSLVSGTNVLDGNNSKFALAMRATQSTYNSYQPRSMMEVAAEYAGLPNGIRATASAVQHMAVNSDQKYPCSKRAVAKLSEAFRVLVVAAARAEAMNTLFRDVHKFDIQRFQDPRTNEWMWNVTPTASHAPKDAMFMPGRIEAGCVLMAVLYKTFDPVHMMQVGSEYQGIGYGLTALAESIESLRTRTRDLYPVDDRVLDELGALVQTVRAAADYAAMASKLFIEDHRLEISHNTNPRKGPAAESMWNTPR